MFLIQQITNSSLQTQTLILPNGNQTTLQFQFVPMQYGWFFNLTYNSFILNGVRIVNNPNILLPFQNQIPFGLACYSTNNREPTQQQDFSSGASQLYILDQSEVQQYYKFLQTGTI